MRNTLPGVDTVRALARAYYSLKQHEMAAQHYEAFVNVQEAPPHILRLYVKSLESSAQYRKILEELERVKPQIYQKIDTIKERILSNADEGTNQQKEILVKI